MAYKRWRDLRDRYVKERKKETNFINPSGEPYKSRWELMPHLQFLQDTIRHRENFNNPIHSMSLFETSTLVCRKPSYFLDENDTEAEITSQITCLKDQIEFVENETYTNKNNLQDTSTSLVDVRPQHFHTIERGASRNRHHCSSNFNEGISLTLDTKDAKEFIISNVKGEYVCIIIIRNVYMIVFI